MGNMKDIQPVKTAPLVSQSSFLEQMNEENWLTRVNFKK